MKENKLKNLAIKLRRKNKVHFALTLDFKVLEKLRIEAEKNEVSISGLANEIIKEYLKEELKE